MILVYVIGGVFIVGLWLMGLADWRRMVYGLLYLVPFAGVPILLSGHNPFALVLKDILFVVPLYFSLFILHSHELKGARVPGVLLFAMISLAVLVLLESLNPEVTVIAAALIGAKVWLFYLPLVFVMGAMIRTPEDHVRLLRTMVVLSVIPCAVGLAQWFLSLDSNYRYVMQAFYGEAAKEATQGYASFEYGGTFFRIPSTFSFVTQYYGFLLSMLVVAYISRRIDPSPTWRFVANLVFYLLIFSSFLAGSRQAYVFTPMLLLGLYLLDGRLRGTAAIIVVVPVLTYGALDLGGLDPLRVLGVTQELTGQYGEKIVLESPLRALEDLPLGMGTGSNTGPARYAFPHQILPSAFLPFNIESYYTKAIVELGIPGLFAVIGLFVAVVVSGFRARLAARTPETKTAAAAYTTFALVMMVQSLKGWSMDVDPINVYFWLFAGILCKLPYLEAPATSRARSAPTPPRYVGRTPRMLGRPSPGRFR